MSLALLSFLDSPLLLAADFAYFLQKLLFVICNAESGKDDGGAFEDELRRDETSHTIGHTIP